MMLFLGSGASIPTGLPRVAELMDAILYEEWYKHTDQLFYSGKPVDWGMADPTASVQRFLRHVKGLADAAHAKRGIDPANYEDLFYILQQIADQERGEQRNAAVEPFISSLQGELSAFPINQGHSTGYATLLTALSSMGSDLIQSVVRNKLSTNKPPIGLDLVRNLAARQQITIVTLNHDLLIERLFNDAQIEFADGFTPPDGEVRWFDEKILTAGTKMRLLKLHGSINWFHMSAKGAAEKGPKTVIPLKGDPWHCKTATGETLSSWSGEPLFLTGIANKIASYNLGIFAEMFFRFHEALKTTDVILMSGYGWADKGINMRLVDWLFASSQHRLMLLHEHPEDFVNRLTPLTHRRDWLVNEGRLIEIRKWMKDLTLPELDALLASLQNGTFKPTL